MAQAEFEYAKGNISSTQTTEKATITIEEAKKRALKSPNCIGFSVESDKTPTESKEYLIHFKEGNPDIYEIGKWHSYLCPAISIFDQAQQLESKLEIKDRRYRMKSYKNCFVGSEAVQVMIAMNLAGNEEEAIAFGNKLIYEDMIYHVEKNHTFKNEKLFYTFTDKYHQWKQNPPKPETPSKRIIRSKPQPQKTPSTNNSANNQTQEMAEQKSKPVELAYNKVVARDPNQDEFLTAVKEVIDTLGPLLEKYPKYNRVLSAICEPERIFQFRVPWVDDQGVMQINRGFRVQFNSAIGPYKGGLRFHPSVNQSIVKFLGFEQIFKNALTGLPMGGGKGGSDFDPKGKSDAEVLRFCQSFMTELSKYIGADIDVPAGDIGVGGREIGFMFGQWKRLTTKHVGVLTGKGYGWGGSLIRPEATGYGLVYITQYALQDIGESFKGKRVAVSGSGNVATFCVEKLFELGATVISLSDSGGSVIEPDGFTKEQFEQIRKIKERRGRIKEYSGSKHFKFIEKKQPWQYCTKVDVALPSATQNEIDGDDAAVLVQNGCKYVAEGANMPSTPEAIEIFKKNCKFYIPAKASNAGGVGVSGLEMSQNSQRVEWSREEVDKRLQGIMKRIFVTIRDTAKDLGKEGDFQLGANAAGFQKVADAMLAQGMAL